MQDILVRIVKKHKHIISYLITSVYKMELTFMCFNLLYQRKVRVCKLEQNVLVMLM